MAILKDKEEEKGQGTSGVLGQAAPEQQQGMPQEQESSGPANIGGSSATQTSAPVKAMPKQQKAGTGTFANLKSYLQAAQGGGQQRVAQAAAGQVQRLGAGAQKATQQAQKTFGTQMQAGSLAGMETAGQEAADIIKGARATTYQAPQQAQVQTQSATQEGAEAPVQAPATLASPKTGRGINQNDEYLKSTLGDKYADFQKDLQNASMSIGTTDMLYNPVTGSYGSSSRARKVNSIYEKYGIDVTKLPSYTPFDQYKAPELKKEGVVTKSTSTLTQPQAPAQPQQYFTPEQTQRFADIINAQYQGPQSLQQAGLYDPAAQKARTAQQAGQLTQTALGREQLLRDVFGRQRDYGRGVSKLDALLLNASQQGVQQLQEQAQPALQAQQALQSAQNLSANEAAQRKAAIEQIRSGARGELTGARTQEEQAVEKRIDDLTKTPAVDEQGNKIPLLDSTGKQVVDAGGNPVFQTEWDRLPEYFRQSLANKATQTKTIQQEALAGLQTQFKPQIEAESQLNAQKNALSRQLEDIQTRLTRANVQIFGASSSGDGSVNSAKREQLSKKASEIANQINQLDSQLAGVKSTPEYQQYQQQLAQANAMNMSQWTLSPEEAAVLGIQAGEGLYNIRPEDIQTAKAERERLITKDELSRQLALAQLAGTDLSRELQKDLLYTDLEKAGTQDLSSSLDVDAFRRLLNEAQQGFKESAEGATITGTGAKKVSRGNILGKKTKTYYAQQEGNVADMLRQAGYDVSKLETSEAKSLLSNKDLLNKYLKATSTSRDEEGNRGFNALEGAGTGAAAGASIGTAINPGIGTALGGAAGALVGGAVGANTLDSIQFQTDLAKELEEKLGIKGLGALGQGVEDIRGIIASPLQGLANIGGSSVVGDVFRGISGAVSGIDTGKMKSYGESIAKQGAIEDLKNKYAQWLAGQGFENRANIADTETTRARSQALQDLLRRQG